MSCGQVTKSVEKQLCSNGSGTDLYEPFTEWLPAVGLDAVRAVIKQYALSNFQCRFGYQTADVRTDKPNAWASNGSLVTTPEVVYDVDLSAVTPGKFFIRFGVCYQGTGAGAGRGTVALQTSFDACGKIVGSHSFQAYAENANDYYQPVTGWIPTIHVDKVKAAIIVSGVQVSGVTFDYNLAFQTAATSPEGPDAWSSTFLSGNTLQSGAAEWASGELSWASAPTNKMWVRYGVHYKSSGASRAGAFVSAAVAVRK
jgi:hypothetical protein